MMKKKFPEIIQAGKHLYFVLRSDPDALIQLRQLFLAVCICIAAAFAAQIIMVEPRLASLEKKISQQESLQQSNATNESILLSAQLYSLEQQLNQLLYAINILTLQEKLLREQWQHQGSNDLFNQVIFTLAPKAPPNMEPHLLKMNQDETRSIGGFNLYPVHLEGHSYFKDFYHYLAYLEESPEIGFLDGLELAADSNALSARAKVSFKLTLGRLEISHDL